MKRWICAALVVALLCACPAAARAASVFDGFTPFTRSRALSELGVSDAESIFSNSFNRANFTFLMMLDIMLATGMSVESSDYTFHWRDDSYVGRCGEYELIATCLMDARPGVRNAVMVMRHHTITNDGSYRVYVVGADRAPYFAEDFVAIVCGEDRYYRNSEADVGRAIDIMNEKTGMNAFNR